MDVDSHAPNQESAVHKRPSPPSEEEELEDEEAVMDQILPAAAAMKRRRIEEEKNRNDNWQPVTAKTAPAKPDTGPKKGRTQKNKKPMDVRGIAREHRQAEEEAARLNEEALKASIDDTEISKMRNLALIENMPVNTRSERTSADPGVARGQQWDERWNGRKNFKKFRRCGEAGQAQPRRGGTVIVGLEEVQKKSLGLTEEYWLEGDKHRKRMETAARVTAKSQSHSHALRRQTVQAAKEEDQEMTMMEESNPGPGRATAATTQATSSSALRSRGKRTVSNASITPANPTSKRQRTTLFVREGDSDDDSEDELRFRFNKAR